jgi:putative transposase
MARPLRPEHPGAVWHVWNRGVNRNDIVFDDGDRALFVALLAEAVRRFHWAIHQFTLMTNHFHLALETPEPTLSRGMKWFEGKFVQAINRRHGRVGPLFQGRFKSQMVEKGSYLLTLIRYIALNPVRAGMVERPEQYRWSSYRWIAGFEEAPGWIDPRWVLAQFGAELESQQREFRKFVDAGRGITRAPWLDAVGQILIGSERWVEKMRPVLEAKPYSTDHPAMQRYASRPRPAKIVEVVAEVFETTVEDIRNGHGTIERQVVAWLGCYEGICRLGSIGTVLRLRSTSRVSALIAECDRDLGERKNKNLRIAVDRCLDLLRRDMQPVATLHRQVYPSVAFPAASPP